MTLLQAGYRTYESFSSLAGVAVEGQEALTPIFHAIINAHIEVTINQNGVFQHARAVGKTESKTIIPVTEASAGRTSGTEAHPFSDCLSYLSPFEQGKYTAYLAALTGWAQSEHTHPKVQAVQAYIAGGTLLQNLATAGLVVLNQNGAPGEGKIEGYPYEKCLVRWRVIGLETGPDACWEDPSLFAAYIAYYTSLLASKQKELCTLSGAMDVPAKSHPKGIVAKNFGAKLISANDSGGFTYRGRFATAAEAGSVGVIASQKAHSGLRWVAANHGVVMGGRTFLWWCPTGKELPPISFLSMGPRSEEAPPTFARYKSELLSTLGGYGMRLTQEDDVVVATLDAATTGRLSVTYYSTLSAPDFLSRLQRWYETCCVQSLYYGVTSPGIKQIARCACGTQRDNFIEADDRILRDYVQRLFQCVADSRPLPADIVRSLCARASTPLAYKPANRETVLYTACAVLRKYLNDKAMKEEWNLALDENCKDRSYLYGRLLALAEQVEQSTYSAEEKREGKRETNAIRMQSIFSRRPAYAWRILHEALEPYFKKLPMGLRGYYKNMIEGVLANFSPASPGQNDKLADTYLLGYYHQRAALRTKKENNNKTEETQDGYTE